MEPTISVLIPTLDNPDYLKCVVESIEKNTIVTHEILIHENTIDNNLGLPKSLNLLGKRATGKFILYANDDMYFAPGWDTALLSAVNPKIHFQYITAVMFEPQWENVCMNSPIDFGKAPGQFDEEGFINTWKEKRKITQDIISPYCPIFVTKKLWDEMEGYDERYFPCFGTDPDFAAKIYFTAAPNKAPYEFRGVTNAGVYHFQCVTTNRIENDGYYRQQAQRIFTQKWGMSYNDFYTQCLKIGEKCKR